MRRRTVTAGVLQGSLVAKMQILSPGESVIIKAVMLNAILHVIKNRNR